MKFFKVTALPGTPEASAFYYVLNGNLVDAYITSKTGTYHQIAGVEGEGGDVAGVTTFNTRSGAVTLTLADVTTALGFTPEPEGNYLTGIDSGMVINALGFTPQVAGSYAAASHTHAIGDITNLQLSLDAKAALAGAAFTGAVSNTAEFFSQNRFRVSRSGASNNDPQFYGVGGTVEMVAGASSGGTHVFFGSYSNHDVRIYRNNVIHGTFDSSGFNLNVGTIRQGGTQVSLAGHTHVIGDVTGLQTALDAKQAISPTIDAKSGDYTLVAADNGKVITFSATATVTVGTSLPAGFNVMIAQMGAGQVTVAGGTLRNASTHTKTRAQYATASILVIANPGSAPEYLLQGDTAA